MTLSSGNSAIKYIFCISVVIVLMGCSNESDNSSVADTALKELQEKYDELKQTEFDDPATWAADDFENIGDWEYRVLQIPYTSAVQLEEDFNKLGDAKWEVFWIERSNAGFMVILKKPSVSYLSKIPFSQIGRFVIGEPESSE